MLHKLMALSDAEKIKRFEQMAFATHSHLDGRDLLKELHPRKILDIRRRIDGHYTWFEGDWLSNLMKARDGHDVRKYHKIPIRAVTKPPLKNQNGA